MKKLIFTIGIFVVLLFSINESFAKHCSASFNVGGTNYLAPFYVLSISADTLFNVGDTINLPITVFTGGSGACTCTSDSIWWIHNGILLSNSISYTVLDTGVYDIYDNVTAGQSCVGGTYNFQMTLHVGYRDVTSVNENANRGTFNVYPSVSTGIFNIKNNSETRIKNIAVTDEEGRIIYATSTDLSEINISAFSNGLYYYTAVDEAQRTYRGKLMKY